VAQLKIINYIIHVYVKDLSNMFMKVVYLLGK
jgi:hypothetical protein